MDQAKVDAAVKKGIECLRTKLDRMDMDMGAMGGGNNMLAGCPPFRAESAIGVLRKHEEEPLPAMSTFPPGVSGEAYRLLVRMMAKNPVERFQDYRQVLEGMERC